MSAHETIMRLRKEFNISEEPISKKEAEKERKELEARAKRLEIAKTDENYVKLFNRDPWTDEWLGPGPEEPMPFLEDVLSKKDQQYEIKKRQEREHQEFINKMGLDHKLPEIKMKESKQVKEYYKMMKKIKKKKTNKIMYQKANWFLNEYCNKWYKDEIMHNFNYDVQDIIIFCNEQIEALEFLCQYEKTYKNDKRSFNEKLAAIELRKEEREFGITEIDGIKWKPVSSAYSSKKEIEINHMIGIPEIPDEHWLEYSKWVKDNPVKCFKKKAEKWQCDEIVARRIVFIKMINKRNKKWRKSMVLTDPLTGMAFLSEKKLKKYKNQQIKRFTEQRREYAKYVQKMVDKGYISEDYMISYLGDDEKAIDRIKKRYKDIEERARKESKKNKEDEAHKRKRDKERKEWFKKYGYDIKDINKPFEIKADGEMLTIRPIISGKNKVWALDQKGSTKYEENIENFMN